MTRPKLLFFIPLVLISMQPASAQIFEDMNYDRCEVTKLHDYMYVPFGITVTHDPALAQKIIDYHPDNPVAQLSKAVPENPSNDPSQATWITLTSNSTANWFIQLSLDYAERSDEIPRKVIIEYKSRGIPVFIENLSHTGKSWCRIFEIRSAPAPHQFTEQEILSLAGQIDKADRNELKLLQIENTNAIKGYTSVMGGIALVFIAVIIIIILMVRAGGAKSQQLEQRHKQLNTDFANINEYLIMGEANRDIRYSDIIREYDSMLHRIIDTVSIILGVKETKEKYMQSKDLKTATISTSEGEQVIPMPLLMDDQAEPQKQSGFMGLVKKKQDFNLEESIAKFYNEYKDKTKYPEEKLYKIHKDNYGMAVKNHMSEERARCEAINKVIKERRGIK